MRRSARRRGIAAMEFAFWLPVVMTLLGGIVDVGWYLSCYQNIVRAARSGARVGAATLEDNGVVEGSQIEAAAISQAELVLDGVGMECTPTNGCDIDAVWDTSSGRAAIVVSVSYPAETLVGIVPVPDPITAQFTMMTQQQP